VTLKQLSERTGIPYGTVIDHKKKGLLCFSMKDGQMYISDQEYDDYLRRIANKDLEVASIVEKMLLTLDDTIGEIRVNRISDDDMENFQIRLEPMIKTFLEGLEELVRDYEHKF
jgi:hypothetical protein